MLPQIATHAWASAAPERGNSMAWPVQGSYFRLTFRPVPVSKRHGWIHCELVQHTPGPAQPRSGETAWPGRSPHFSPGAGVKTSRLNPLRTRKVFAPASVLDPTSVTWFLQFQRLTKKHVATVNPHDQAGPGKLFSPHFSPGSDVKTSRLMARPVQESHFRLTFRLVPMSKRRVWIHYELVRFLVQLRFFGNHGF